MTLTYLPLPGGGGPASPRSPTAVAGQVIQQLSRPSRLRGRVVLGITGAIVLCILVFAQSHPDEINKTASAFSSYVPSISHPFSQPTYDPDEWNHRSESTNTTDELNLELQKPMFHLLIPAKTSSLNVCRAILSAAVLDYPPVTLINYRGGVDKDRQGLGDTRSTYKYLAGKEVHDDDLVMISDEATWFQLPAEILITRFMENLLKSNSRLLEVHGYHSANSSDGEKPVQLRQKYTQKLLFAAGKSCYPNSLGHPACYSVPESTLPAGIKSPALNESETMDYDRPKFLKQATAIGRAADMRDLYGYASMKLEKEESGLLGSQFVFAEIFGEQEYLRRQEKKEKQGAAEGWRDWIAAKVGVTDNSLPENITITNVTVEQGKTYEYGIGLDYENSIFQVMSNSSRDIRFINFTNNATFANLSTSVTFPYDLNHTNPPFYQHKEPKQTVILPYKDDLDNVPKDARWSELDLVANIAIPGSQVPASLTFNGNEDLLKEWWEMMWYKPHARALMRQYLRSPLGKVAAEAAAEGGDQWWDLRGGKGGVWTDGGEWLSWNSVCGEYDDKVFGDGKGAVGKEFREPVYNSFGILIAGSE